MNIISGYRDSLEGNMQPFNDVCRKYASSHIHDLAMDTLLDQYQDTVNLINERYQNPYYSDPDCNFQMIEDVNLKCGLLRQIFERAEVLFKP